MDKERYKLLMEDDSVQLTESELFEGWHFCYDWDGLLISPKMGEWKFCECNVL